MDYNSRYNQHIPSISSHQENNSYAFNLGGNILSEQEIPVSNNNIKNKSRVSSGLLKLFILIMFPLFITIVAGTFFLNKNVEAKYFKEQNILMAVPMKNENWQDVGSVFEPIIPLKIKTTNGYQDWEFLLDSGAVISSLPRDWADKTGQDLAMLKRSTFRGFGNSTSFAYHGNMTVKLGDHDFTIPVVFTEKSGTKSLLGRKGFFEQHSIYFNSETKKIEIRN